MAASAPVHLSQKALCCDGVCVRDKQTIYISQWLLYIYTYMKVNFVMTFFFFLSKSDESISLVSFPALSVFKTACALRATKIQGEK